VATPLRTSRHVLAGGEESAWIPIA
jgi:hypothetical protein